MIWMTRLIIWLPPVLTAIILIYLLYVEFFRRGIAARTGRRALLIVIAIYILALGAKVTYLYFQLKSDEFGKYLLPPNSRYFYEAIWAMSSPYLLALIVGFVLILVLLALQKVLHAELVDSSDIYILMLVIFVVGVPSILVLILGSFFLMLFFLLGFSVRQKKMATAARLAITPFLLLVALAILVLNNFNFYLEFLTLLRLT